MSQVEPLRAIPPPSATGQLRWMTRFVVDGIERAGLDTHSC